MQRNILYSIIVLFFLTGCEDELKEKVKFDMSVQSEGSTMEGDVWVVQKATDVTFYFSGNPDFITFYSGESGRAYINRERTLLSKDDISSELRFSSFAEYGTIPGAFKVYLSTSFGELSLNSEEDRKKIQTHEWIDITDQCDLPIKTGANEMLSNAISLEDYLGENLNIAFVYKPLNDGKTQPTWEIQSLKVVNTSKQDGSEAALNASSMGITPFDIYAEGEVAYKSYDSNVHAQRSGVWDFTNISAAIPRIRMQSSTGTDPLNEDWLITKPMLLNACTPDTGVGIKTITVRLDSYTYQYEKAGEYTVTMVARNSNMKASSEVIKEIQLKVID